MRLKGGRLLSQSVQIFQVVEIEFTFQFPSLILG